jgi:hypothetical protein
MRKITIDSINAFMGDRTFKRQNMEVQVVSYNTTGVRSQSTMLLLHGNVIAVRNNDSNRSMYITDCGWRTRTTKERLNGLEGVNIVQRDFQWYLNGVVWDGSPVFISTEVYDSAQDEADRLRLHEALNELNN